jgi:glycosyltransferase involved in cell wall biosynthesis
MKILVIQDFLRSGGTERQSILLANAFAAAGHPAMLLTFRPGGALVSTIASNVTHRSLQSFDLRLDWFAPGLSAEVQRFAPDVILCMGRMANSYAGDLQREFPAITVIATMRTGRKLPAIFVRSLGAVRHVVANSREARDTLTREYAIPPEKISVIYNALVFPPAAARDVNVRDALRSQFGAARSTTVLLCVAMFRPEKNQRGLIETVAGLMPELDWQLWLAGDGSARASCEQLVAAKQLGSRVKFPGFLRDPSTYYLAADIAVHASGSEALSNFLIEAQAHGLPAVVYQTQGMEECFIPHLTGWAIPREDADGFRAAILALARESESARTKRSITAQSFARETFEPQRQVAAYLELFARLG